MKYANIVDGVVFEVVEPVYVDQDNGSGSTVKVEVPIAERYHPEFVWVSAPDDVAQGWIVQGDVLVAPPAQSETVVPDESKAG